MAFWDAANTFWDSGIRYDEPAAPNPTTKTKRKSMRRQAYFPLPIAEQIVWLGNFKTKLPLYATILSLVPAEVTARLLDTDNALYALQNYRGALGPFSDAAYERIEDALFNPAVPGNVTWPAFAAPTPVPATVLYGCLKRVFDYINDVIKDAAAYDATIGADLRTEGPMVAEPSPTGSPEFTLRKTTGGKMEVVWTRGVFDGVKLEFDLGPAGLKNDVDLRPNYTLNWLPATNTSAIIKVRLRHIYKGEDHGDWSAWQSFTLTGE